MRITWTQPKHRTYVRILFNHFFYVAFDYYFVYLQNVDVDDEEEIEEENYHYLMAR